MRAENWFNVHWLTPYHYLLCSLGQKFDLFFINTSQKELSLCYPNLTAFGSAFNHVKQICTSIKYRSNILLHIEGLGKCKTSMPVIKGVGRNFSRGGLSGAPGEGSPAIFQFPGGGSTQLFGRFNGQNERIFGPGGHAPSLPMPAYALALHHNILNVWSIFLQKTIYKSHNFCVFTHS